MSAITVTKDNFQSQVVEANCDVLLDFWAPWCGPCRMVSPVIEEIADERKDIRVGKVNVDEETELAVRFGVMSIPTIALLRGGEVIAQSVGVRPKEDILSMLD